MHGFCRQIGGTEASKQVIVGDPFIHSFTCALKAISVLPINLITSLRTQYNPHAQLASQTIINITLINRSNNQKLLARSHSCPMPPFHQSTKQCSNLGWVVVVFAFPLWWLYLDNVDLMISLRFLQMHSSLSCHWGSIILQQLSSTILFLVSVSLFISSASKFMLSFSCALCSSRSGGSPTLGAGATGERASLSLPT